MKVYTASICCNGYSADPFMVHKTDVSITNIIQWVRNLVAETADMWEVEKVEHNYGDFRKSKDGVIDTGYMETVYHEVDTSYIVKASDDKDKWSLVLEDSDTNRLMCLITETEI